MIPKNEILTPGLVLWEVNLVNFKVKNLYSIVFKVALELLRKFLQMGFGLEKPNFSFIFNSKDG